MILFKSLIIIYPGFHEEYFDVLWCGTKQLVDQFIHIVFTTQSIQLQQSLEKNCFTLILDYQSRGFILKNYRNQILINNIFPIDIYNSIIYSVYRELEQRLELNPTNKNDYVHKNMKVSTITNIQITFSDFNVWFEPPVKKQIKTTKVQRKLSFKKKPPILQYIPINDIYCEEYFYPSGDLAFRRKIKNSRIAYIKTFRRKTIQIHDFIITFPLELYKYLLNSINELLNCEMENIADFGWLEIHWYHKTISITICNLEKTIEIFKIPPELSQFMSYLNIHALHVITKENKPTKTPDMLMPTYIFEFDLWTQISYYDDDFSTGYDMKQLPIFSRIKPEFTVL